MGPAKSCVIGTSSPNICLKRIPSEFSPSQSRLLTPKDMPRTPRASSHLGGHSHTKPVPRARAMATTTDRPGLRAHINSPSSPPVGPTSHGRTHHLPNRDSSGPSQATWYPDHLRTFGLNWIHLDHQSFCWHSLMALVPQRWHLRA